jgi:CRISPR-associated protein Cmr6
MARAPIPVGSDYPSTFVVEAPSLAAPPLAGPFGAQQRGPNLSLVWQRFLPRRDHASDLGLPTSSQPDFSAEWAAAARPDPRQQASARGRVKRAADEWHGHGVHRWFLQLRADDTFLGAAIQRRLAEFDGTSWRAYCASWRVAIGLGNASIVENSGVAFEPTYGFPILPAASLKGLARHYLREELGASALTEPCFASLVSTLTAGGTPLAGLSVQKACDLLFGGEAENAAEGMVAFYDGWPTSGDNGFFDVDVLTSHHPEYYADAQPAAADTDKPRPIHFLTVRQGLNFQIGLAPSSAARRFSGPVGSAAVECVHSLLAAALKDWGIGAKTGAGYGRLRASPQRPQQPTPEMAPVTPSIADQAAALQARLGRNRQRRNP